MSYAWDEVKELRRELQYIFGMYGTVMVSNPDQLFQDAAERLYLSAIDHSDLRGACKKYKIGYSLEETTLKYRLRFYLLPFWAQNIMYYGRTSIPRYKCGVDGEAVYRYVSAMVWDDSFREAALAVYSLSGASLPLLHNTRTFTNPDVLIGLGVMFEWFDSSSFKNKSPIALDEECDALRMGRN